MTTPISRTAVDTVIAARWIVPVEPRDCVLSDHALVIAEGRIQAVLPAVDARAQFDAANYVELDEHILIPGLVNLHTHAAMTLMRGLADDRALMVWLQQHIWPAEMRCVSTEFVYDGTRLACAEMLRGGITCFNDMYFFPQASVQAALETRMRTVAGLIVLETPSPYAADAQDYLSKGLAIRDEYRGEALVKFSIAPHAPYTVSDKTLRQVAMFADELDLPVHMHVHESKNEIEASLKEYGVRPLERVRRLGLLGPHLIAVHTVHVQSDEMELLARHGSHVAHCPSSNLKLASGIAPVARLLAAGVNVGLGTDSAASNNRLDILAEMRLAGLLAKAISEDAAVLPAARMLELATLRAAQALGLDEAIGSLVPGKFADIAALRLTGPELTPCYHPLSHLAYAAGREHVSHVWVNGELLVDNGNLPHFDIEEVQAKAVHWRDRILPHDR